MSEEQQIKRGGAARYLAMVACVLLGGFVYVGWRLKKGDEINQHHRLAAGVEDATTNSQGLNLSIPKSENPRIITSDLNDDDILSDLTIGSESEYIPQVSDTPDDIDIEALLTSAPPAPQSIGGISGNDNLDVFLPESEEVSQPDFAPPPAPAPESFAQQQPQSPASDNLLEEVSFTDEVATPTPEKIQTEVSNTPDSAPLESLSNITYRDYKVRRGDTLSKIAQHYLGSRKRANEIYAINKDRMSSPNLLRVGMTIRVPFDRNSHRTSSHRISTTDSLPSIAMRYYGSAEPEIIEGIRIANPVLSQGGFREGTKLTIPPLEVVQETPVEIFAQTPAGVERVYVVRSGDTLSRIAARKYGNSNKWRAIYNANRDKIRKPSAIRVGMTLRLP